MLDTETLTIDTPEQVGLEFALAGVGSRALAVIIDTLLQAFALAVLFVSLAVAATFMGPFVRPVWILAGAILAIYLVQTFYFAYFEIAWQGQTPGKRRVGIRVIKESGRGLTVYESLVRNLLRPIDAIPGPYGVGILSALVTSRAQRLGDLAAGSLVVRERDVADADAVVAARRGRSYGAARLPAAEIQLIETYLARRGDLDLHVRLDVQGRVAARIAAVLGLDATQVADDDAFLAAVADEYRAAPHSGR